ncbi:UDP-N-acetylmuramate:L-alanyl-gamma-D-glutamyl-meso-diaminopimelate ligase [Alcanivorax sp. 1008]|uniref:UDP-N-acetylmuramate:L-alanyl-gamma-D-glutamyl- meso-diaminopimelate ligase n=1 Tax=Alcanivorax sp. 1008 TaxID=2816853 RepID=UPI001D9B5CC2|nr:UDP-N-acetylmuramate:L-alanyl-gamma-D-glutamyl-meso-diaminopimelate ligase [Alcanivorax sp. 1008]MCC1497491.1 UDP-N-acetylmuramate:L-alanyl-gamma-D-glutamyl-meso-diaminopimelate ligase [Alcanivorax sp. 1008]
MHIHILGICGTFMGSLAQLARDMGHRVTGADTNVYPPMSDQLRAAGIEIHEGYDAAQLDPAPDLVVIGNAMSRGNPAVEEVLNRGLRYTSGPQMLADVVLPDRWVIAVAGTHGKTTTASMVSWLLEAAGMAPGFLIGGVPGNFPVSARLGETPFFVVEADEYDTAFFDKRSKFIHYRPRTVILNNLEFDHADIFENLGAIQKQFHHLIRTIPGNGRIILPSGEMALEEVLDKGCWSEVERFGAGAGVDVQLLKDDGSHFAVLENGSKVGEVRWGQTGVHSVNNGMAALLAARHVGVPLAQGCELLADFLGVKRRMELVGEIGGVRVYDDFAHHPTAIATTLEGLRKKVGTEKIIAVIEPRSNTMRMGAHRDKLANSVLAADEVIWYQPEGINWSLDDVVKASEVPAKTLSSIDAVIADICSRDGALLNVVVMSNGGFGGIHRKLVEALQRR